MCSSGPQHRGYTDFGKQFMFGNNMYLIEDQVSFLFYRCDPGFPPKIENYVYKLTYSYVMRIKCKLVR
jgi:hypothetical protein